MKKIFLTFLFLLVWGSGNVLASSSAIPFSVKAEIPENQVDKRQTYFDLRLLPGEEQEIYLEVRNASDEEIGVDIHLFSADTGRNGVIVYNEVETPDESMLYPITELAVLEENTVVIDANASKRVKAKIQMPDEEIDGIILGGFSVSLNEAYSKEPEAASGVSLNNEFVYVTGLRITQNENVPEPALHLKSVSAQTVNYYPAVVFNIQNSEAMLMNNVHIIAEVYKSGRNEVYKQYENEYAQFAPNSNGDFVIDWDNNTIESGRYKVVVTASYEDYDWQWEETLTISTNEVNDINEESVVTGQKTFNWWIWLLVLLAILFFGWGAEAKRIMIKINTQMPDVSPAFFMCI